MRASAAFTGSAPAAGRGRDRDGGTAGVGLSAMASDLNSLALVGVEDIFRGFRPEASDRARLGLAKDWYSCAEPDAWPWRWG